MLNVTQKLHDRRVATDQLILPFELRQKSRLRTHLASGVEVGLFLERGTVLRGGDQLQAEEGTIIEVVAADETVSTVVSADPSQLARAGYHLGNRHVAVQIGKGWLRYRYDHVLDDMVRGLGLEVIVEQAPFEPESGAYGHSHSHAPAPFAPAPTPMHAHERSLPPATRPAGNTVTAPSAFERANAHEAASAGEESTPVRPPASKPEV